MNFGTVRFGNQGVRRLLDPVVKEFVGVLDANDKPSLEAFPKCRVNLFLCFPLNQGQSRDLGDIA